MPTPYDLQPSVGDQEQDTPGLLDSLRSRGTLPLELMMMLQQQARPAPQANPFAVALAGGVSAMRGQPNPVLEQQAAMQQQQHSEAQLGPLRMGLALMKMQQEQRDKLEARAEKIREFQIRQKERQEDRQNAQNEAVLRIGSALFQKEGTEAVGAQYMTEALRGMGREVPTALLGGIATGRLTRKEYDDLTVDIHGLKYTDEQVRRKYPNATPQDIQDIRNLPKSPTLAKMIGLPDEDEVQRRKLDNDLKQGQVAEQQLHQRFPDLKNITPIMADAIRIHRETGLEYTAGTPQSQQAALDEAQRRHDEREAKRLDEQSARTTQRMLELLEARERVKTAKPPDPAKMQKLLDGFRRENKILRDVGILQDLVDKIPAKAFPSGPGWAPDIAATTYRTLFLKGDRNLGNFLQNWSAITIGEIDRVLRDEKGARSIRAYGPQVEVGEGKLPPRVVIKDYLATVRRAVTEDMQNDLDTAPTLNYPPEVIRAMQQLSASGGVPTPERTSPLSAPLSGPRPAKIKGPDGSIKVMPLYPGEALPKGYSEVP